MEKYVSPEIEIVEIKYLDIITASPGTETSIEDESDGIWDLTF